MSELFWVQSFYRVTDRIDFSISRRGADCTFECGELLWAVFFYSCTREFLIQRAELK
jgi:hypothetical protein